MRRHLAIGSVVLALALALGLTGRARADGEHELLAKADEITAKVEKIRGLAKRRNFAKGVMSKAQILERLKLRVSEDYGPGELEGESMAMKRLGLLPADADYLAIVLKLLADQVAGFYDPATRELYIADWSSFGGDMLMAHEIDHALQDQHFDLKKFMATDKHDGDGTAARQALVEGDGTALMLEYVTRDAGQTVTWEKGGLGDKMSSMMAMSSAMLGDQPLVLREGLVFPYAHGAGFVASFLAKGGWPAVDAVFASPPRSTEQILHPEKYAAGEQPIAVTAAIPAALHGAKLAYDNVSGELGLQIFLRQHGVADDVAAQAAAGWGGDRLALISPRGYAGVLSAQIAVSYSVWDSEADARELFAALATAMPKLTQGRPVEVAADHLMWKDDHGAVTVAERHGDAVVLVVGAPPAWAQEIATEAWTSWKVKR